MKETCRSAAEKISSYVHVFHSANDVIEMSYRKLLYNDLVYPHQTYCYTVWSVVTILNLEPIHKMQKTFARIIAGERPLENSAPVFRSSNMLNILTLINIS